MISIDLYEKIGSFAENKDIAREIRTSKINPALNQGENVVLNFENITLTTQSFVHALISDLIRNHGVDVLDKILFKNCCDSVKTLINVVCDYMQDGVEYDE